jgi:hypothetical protein
MERRGTEKNGTESAKFPGVRTTTEVDGMPEIGDIKPTLPTWGRRPVDRVGPDSRRPKPPGRKQPHPRDDRDGSGDEDGKDDSRGGQIDEYA